MNDLNPYVDKAQPRFLKHLSPICQQSCKATAGSDVSRISPNTAFVSIFNGMAGIERRQCPCGTDKKH